MLENLKIALKKQRRLLVTFLLAVFLPSLLLGIFGIRSIRNERYKQARQLELDHRRAAESLRTQVSSVFRDLEQILQNLAQSSAFKEMGGVASAGSIRARLENNPLVESAFICFEGEEPWFLLFQPRPTRTASRPTASMAGPFQEALDRGGAYEFVEKDYEKAAAVYGDLARRANDRDFQARMLHEQSRCLMKLKRYAQAIVGYDRISRDFPDSISASGIPLALTSGLMKIQCYGDEGDHPNALKAAFGLFEAITEMRWSLNEVQFRTYGGLAEERIEEALAKTRDLELVKSGKSQLDKLKGLFQEKLEQWKLIGDIKREVIPDLWPRVSALPDASTPVRYAKAEKAKLFLAIAVRLSDKPGFLGLTVKTDYFLRHVLAGWMSSIRLNDRADLVLSDLDGNVVLGNPDHPAELRTVTEFFAGNFPPWKMEFYRTKAVDLEMRSLKSNFYFWTVLTLVVILTFGTVLIIRTIAQELDILRLKSDFVSSVSHEFKTPLTSMKALLERLQDDKVHDRDRMKQYFSLLSQNADRLIRLVKNLLDFSKIEEGKKEYDLRPTDIAELVTQEVRDFEKQEFHSGVEIRAAIPEGIPLLMADREALSQAIHNLLDNAVKFSPERKGIEVSVRKEEGSIIIEVADQGIGIPPDELERIFDKFYQGQNAVRQIAKGTGLGLTLVKYTVEAHGGRVLVRSRVGEGTTFSLVFPIKKQ